VSVSTAEQPVVHAVPELEEPDRLPRGPALNFLRGIDKAIVKVEKVLLVLSIVLILAAILTQIAAGIFRWSITGGMEISVFAMLALSLLAGSITTHYRRHITIDVLYRLLPAKGRTIITTVTDLFGFILMAYLCRVAVFYVAMNRSFGDYNSPALKIPYWWVQALIPFALGVIAFRFLLHFLEDIKRIQTGNWLPESNSHADLRM
jgi:TRAP-type C4-dicarboxylate transport system permease small subunit